MRKISSTSELKDARDLLLIVLFFAVLLCLWREGIENSLKEER